MTGQRWNPSLGQRPRAIVLGVEHPRGVAVVRSLGRAGVAVDAVDHVPSARGFSSRYLQGKYLVSPDTDQTLEFLESLSESKGNLLIPTTDHYLIFAATHYERLCQSFTVTSPSWDVVERLMDKPRCYKIARAAGIATPDFFTPNDAEDLRRVISELEFGEHSYILKTKLWSSGPADPATSRFSRDAGEDASTALERCQEIYSRLGVFPMIEEVVPGESDTCIGVSMVVDRNHEPVLRYCVRRLKLFLYSRRGFAHPYELGANVYCESTHDEEALDAAARFVRQAKFFGMITVEFRRSSADGTLNLIKADPRPVRATSLSTALGLDAPSALYRAFTGQKAEVAESYRDGVAWIWLTWWLKALWKNRRDRSVRRELLAVLRNMNRIRAFAYLDPLDPMPFLVEIGRQGREWVSAAPSVVMTRLARTPWAAK